MSYKPWEPLDEDVVYVACPVCLRGIQMRRPVHQNLFGHRLPELVLSRHNKAKGIPCEGSGLEYGEQPIAPVENISEWLANRNHKEI